MQHDFLKVTEETEDGFRKIARKLFNDFAIQNENSLFRLTEIEFYWTSPTHKDESVYKRIHSNPSTGEWFFHYSGVDIALKNDELNGYGGILIRGIYDIYSKKSTKGPQVCVMKLFSGINAFTNAFPVQIIDYKFPEEQIGNTERIGLGNNAKISGSDKFKYRFLNTFNDK